MSAHPLWHVRDKMARLIHQRSGHVENHSGSGGCFEAADEIIGMLPADLVKARADLEDLTERANLILAERDRLASLLRETHEHVEYLARKAVEWAWKKAGQTGRDWSRLSTADQDAARSVVVDILAALRTLAGPSPSPSPVGDR
jgi:hypothetical protein